MRSDDERTEPDLAANETRASLLHLGAAFSAVLVMAALSYAVPAFHRFRPWIPGEPLPFTELALHANDSPASVGAGGGYQSGTAGLGADAEETLGAEVAAALRATEEPAGSPVTAPPAPSVRDGGPASDTDAGAEAVVTIAPREYGEVSVPIVDADFRGLRPFFEKLIRVVQGEAVLARVAHYGDSTIASDHVTKTVRHRLQRRFGDGGHGFILVSRGYMPYRHQDVDHEASGGWRIREVTRAAVRDGHYGLGGVQIQARAGGVAHFGTHDDEDVSTGRTLSRYQLFFQRQPEGGNLRITIDEGEPEVLSTASAEGEYPSDAVWTRDVADGPHEMEVRYVGGGHVTVYGVVMEREGPGVVYDSLGLVGARARRMLNFDPGHLERQLRMRGTDLLVIGFGGNDADDNASEERYYEQFHEVVAHMRPDPALGCLIFAPLDQAERDERGAIRTMRTIPRIVAAQRRVAAELGCAFYDTWHAMGGDGAMRRWLRARPPLASADFRHATPEGYRVIGEMYYRALLEAFARYLEVRPTLPPLLESRRGAEAE